MTIDLRRVNRRDRRRGYTVKPEAWQDAGALPHVPWPPGDLRLDTCSAVIPEHAKFHFFLASSYRTPHKPPLRNNHTDMASPETHAVSVPPPDARVPGPVVVPEIASPVENENGHHDDGTSENDDVGGRKRGSALRFPAGSVAVIDGPKRLWGFAEAAARTEGGFGALWEAMIERGNRVSSSRFQFFF